MLRKKWTDRQKEIARFYGYLGWTLQQIADHYSAIDGRTYSRQWISLVLIGLGIPANKCGRRKVK